jgi:hypothetical protein
MAASYASDWPVLPGTEPRPVTPVQWPSPPRIELHRASETTVQLPIQLPTQMPTQLPISSAPVMPEISLMPTMSPTPMMSPTLVMSLPPEAQYNSLEDLYEAAQLHALPRGYAFTKRRSKKINHAGRRKVFIDCDRHDYGNTKANQQRQRERNTNSRANGCPFSIIASSSSDLLS